MSPRLLEFLHPFAEHPEGLRHTRPCRRDSRSGEAQRGRSPAPHPVRAASPGPPGRDGLRCAAGAGVARGGGEAEGLSKSSAVLIPVVPRRPTIQGSNTASVHELAKHDPSYLWGRSILM
jgi:hypothetical protein